MLHQCQSTLPGLIYFCIGKPKHCAIFADTLALLGNIARYDLRLDQQKVLDEKVSFTACSIALALLNGDLSMLSPTSPRSSEINRPTHMPIFGSYELRQPTSDIRTFDYK